MSIKSAAAIRAAALAALDAATKAYFYLPPVRTAKDKAEAAVAFSQYLAAYDAFMSIVDAERQQADKDANQ